MRRRAPLVLMVVVAVLTLVAAGCGGDDEETATGTEEWAQEFCTAVVSWTNELEEIGNRLDDPSALSVDTIRTAAEDAGDATDAFAEEVRELGSPDTDAGDQIEGALESLSDTLDRTRDDVQQAVDGVSDLSDLPSAITELGTSLAAMGTALQDAMEAVEDADVGGELERAFTNADACDELTS